MSWDPDSSSTTTSRRNQSMKSNQDASKKNLFHRMRKNGTKALEHAKSADGASRNLFQELMSSDGDKYNIENIVTRSDIFRAGDSRQSLDDIPLQVLIEKEKREVALAELADAINALDELTSEHATTASKLGINPHQSDKISAGPRTMRELVALRSAIHNVSTAFAHASPSRLGGSHSSSISKYRQVKKIRRKSVPIYREEHPRDSLIHFSQEDDLVDDIQSRRRRSTDETLKFTSAPFLHQSSFTKPVHLLDVDQFIDSETYRGEDLRLLPLSPKKKNRVERLVPAGFHMTDPAKFLRSASTPGASQYLSAHPVTTSPNLILNLSDADQDEEDYFRQRNSSEQSSTSRSNRGYSVSSLESLMTDEDESTIPSSIASSNSSPESKNLDLLSSPQGLGIPDIQLNDGEDDEGVPSRPMRNPKRSSMMVQTKRKPFLLGSVSPENDLHSYVVNYEQYISSDEETLRPSALGFSAS